MKLFSYFIAQDAAHSLTILRSKNAPVIKKRQVMRSSFGDYRTKMAEEEKKLNKGTVLLMRDISCTDVVISLAILFKFMPLEVLWFEWM
jgi:hypothetical protein